MEEKRRQRMVVLSVAILPYQKERLGELAIATGKTKSELVREALSFLFRQYSQGK